MVTRLLLLLLHTAAHCWAAQLDHHRVLGLHAGASKAEIRRAYRSAALINHPDKNPSPDANAKWLQVQHAYDALMGRGGGSGAADPSARSYGHHQQQQRRDAWQRFWQQPRPPQRIPSETDDLDPTRFARWVLGSEGTGSGSTHQDQGGTQQGLPWLIQVYADSSPYCRVLSTHWEEAARELAGLARLGRIEFAAQEMLVRFLASHLRLFYSPYPSHQLPVVVGFPAGCTQVTCAVVYGGRFTAAGLEQFVSDRLLRLPRLPPLSAARLASWRRAAAAAAEHAGGVVMLALLPEGQPQPLELLAAVARAQGRVAAMAAAAWRPSDRTLWADAVGATSAPALIFWRGRTAELTAVVQGSLLTNKLDWGAEVARHTRHGPVPPLNGATAAHAAPACLVGERAERGGGGATPPGALCVLLLGHAGQLAAVRNSLEVLHDQWISTASSSRGWRRQGSSPEQRRVGQLLTERRLQLAWADGGQQQALCTHLLRWAGGSTAAGSSQCLCAPWWQRLYRCRRSQEPVLVAYRQQQLGSSRSVGGKRRGSGQLLVAAFGGASLADTQEVASWLMAAHSEGDPSKQQQKQEPGEKRLMHAAPLPSAPLGPPAGTPRAAAVALWLLHLASRGDLLWEQAAGVAGGTLQNVMRWQQLAVAAAVVAVALLVKWLADSLIEEEEMDEVGRSSSSPQKCELQQRPGSGGSIAPLGSAASWVHEMRQADWEPTPGRYLVVLPMPAAVHVGGGSSGSGGELNGHQKTAQQAQQAQQHFASLAAVWKHERRLVFRVAPVSDAFTSLLSGTAGTAAAASTGAAGPANAGRGSGAAAQQQEEVAAAVVLHPRRGGRFQALPLAGVQQAMLRLEEMLDGGGHWRQGGGSSIAR